MGARYLTDLDTVLTAAGLAVTVQDGWQSRARSSGGFDGSRPWAVMWHHAASAPGASAESVASYASYGSGDAPVCNLVLGRDGAVIVCAAGATNTNGKGGPLELSRGTVPADQMNTHAIGIEAVNTGTGEAWPVAQVDAYFAINNALAAAYGLDPADAVTHAVWAPGRKIDPATTDAVEGPWRPTSTTTAGTWSLDDIRAEATRRAGTAPTPTPPLEDDMLAATIWRHAAYTNTYLIGAGNTVQIAPGLQASLIGRGVPVVTEWDDAMLEVCLHQAGQTHADLIDA